MQIRLHAMLNRLALAGDAIRALSGWRRFGVAVLAGAVSALGFAPFSLWPLLLLGLAAFVLLLDASQRESRSIRSAAIAGFAFGFGQFLVGLHWIGYAFLVDADAHAWQIPFVAVLFPGGLALFFAGAAAVAAYFWKPGIGRIFVITATYSLAEWLRGHILTGFPWNLPAYGWGAVPAILQSAMIFGAYGLTLVTALAGFGLSELFAHRRNWKFLAAIAASFALIFLFGTARLLSTPERFVSNVKVRLVQPNIPQAEKYQRRYILRNWQRLISLSKMPGNPSIIIWPEAAPPFLLAEQPLAMEEITRLLGEHSSLMTGGIRREYVSEEHIRYANSFFLIGKKETSLSIYDKSHLVPFGEYLPFEKTLTALGLSKLTGIDGSFTPGDGPITLDVSGAGKVTPLICYEILFPGEVEASKRPDWFVNITDDSWFGPWAGPKQHLLVARVRAIEEGVPVVRDANTGISAIIDPLGKVTHSLELGKTGFIDGALPAPLPQTPYSRFRDLFFWLLLCANIIAARFFLERK